MIFEIFQPWNFDFIFYNQKYYSGNLFFIETLGCRQILHRQQRHRKPQDLRSLSANFAHDQNFGSRGCKSCCHPLYHSGQFCLIIVQNCQAFLSSKIFLLTLLKIGSKKLINIDKKQVSLMIAVILIFFKSSWPSFWSFF